MVSFKGVSMCEEIYGKIVVMLLLLPISITAVMAVWYGLEVLVDKWCLGIEKDIAKQKTKTPTREQVENIVKELRLGVDSADYIVSCIILTWERIK